MDRSTAFAKLMQNTKVTDTDMNYSRVLILFQQCLNKAEYDVKNYADRGGGYYPSTDTESAVFRFAVPQLLEETGYEKRQTSMIKTTVLQFMFKAA